VATFRHVAVLHSHRLGDPSGEPLLAIHGITGHGMRYRRLAEQGWPDRATLTVDLRGHGRSTAVAPWSIEQHVADLLDTLDDAGWTEPVDVVGHSYGGAIGLRLPFDRVRRLVLLDPAFAVPAERSAEMAAATIDHPGYPDAAAARADRAATLDQSGHWALDEEVAEHLDTARSPMRFRFDRAAVVAGWGELARGVPNLDDPVPTLLVIAEQAGIVRPDVVAALTEELGAALTIRRIDCGHMLYWERFEETAAAVRQFLA
jgi:lipase